MKNNFFIGSFVGPSKVVVFGQDVTYWSVAEQNNPPGGTSTEKSTFSLLQLGPRMIIYMGTDNEFYISVAYHPYAQGKRKIGSTAVQEKVSGSGYIGSFGYHLKVSKVFHLGASLNYHALMLKESIVGNSSSKVSYNYSTYYPMVELSFRF